MSNMNKVLGFERINERVKRPNTLINFIKPLEGPDKALAQDFLERVAAICYPIMKENHIVVMALEEYKPNPEFIGRNFNAGEVIQLVLKAPHTNQWLPFKHVQMVMMHELAHCKQMNHSRAFWKVRNAYADELKVLWDKTYTGEGLWGKGQSLITGLYMTNHMPEAANAPASLCGGTFRSSGGRKRRRKEDIPKVTYAERQQRRIAKKFGVNGVALGDDEGIRAKLESGQKGGKPAVKPRVAGSKRGRELRAAAALARFENVKKEPVKTEPKTETISDDDDYETDSDYEYVTIERTMNPEDGNMVRVCENEDSEDKDAQRELDELREIDQGMPNLQIAPSKQSLPKGKGKAKETVISDDASTESEDEQDLNATHSFTKPSKKIQPIPDDVSTDSGDDILDITSVIQERNKQKVNTVASEPILKSASKQPEQNSKKSQPPPAGIKDESTASESETSGSKSTTPKPQSTSTATIATSSTEPRTTASTSKPAERPPAIPASTCTICSLENEPTAALCAACSHVLNPALMPNCWKCTSMECQSVGYINPGDYNLCGLCGSTKPK
ncbi:WLM-domain-containing protein [Aureobasidium sp. EXF-3400]|nr:WLM-domain-containing protein [Aureobasidium sp. EXF-12344]KAI4769684.1 WLM-domain-containing protein [Aureobasidium sp. EXF-3400]